MHAVDGFRQRSTHPTDLRTTAVLCAMPSNAPPRKIQINIAAPLFVPELQMLNHGPRRNAGEQGTILRVPSVRCLYCFTAAELHRPIPGRSPAAWQHSDPEGYGAYSTVSPLERPGRRCPPEDVGGRRPRSQTGAAFPPLAIGDPREGRAARPQAPGAAGAPADGGRTPRVLTRQRPHTPRDCEKNVARAALTHASVSRS